MNRRLFSISLFCVLWAAGYPILAQPSVFEKFEPKDIFQLEWASSPEISPDGETIVYVRNSNDIMVDRTRSSLWMLNFDGSEHRPLTTGREDAGSPQWSPSGDRLLYTSSDEDDRTQLFVRWMDTGQTAKLTNLTQSPSSLSWSPDGQWIAFTMLVPEKKEPMIQMPEKPEGAEWSEPARVIDSVVYRADGRGFLKPGYSHIFVLSAEGGTPRQITSGNYHHDGPLSWTPEGEHILFSANRHEDWEFQPQNSDVYRISVADGKITPLTDRYGPDRSPIISPDGQMIAYLGYDDRHQGYQLTDLQVMNADGSGERLVSADFDQDISNIYWAEDSRGLYFQYDDQGNTKLGLIDLEGNVRTLASNVGGLSIGRPYSGGTFSVAKNGNLAFTLTSPYHPADVAVVRRGEIQRLTRLNEDLFGHKELGQVEEIWYESSYDQRSIQGWIVKPPDFDPSQKYPLILEIHGGPFANYGDRFSAEIQLYAAAGYVVLYTNPRGSTSYGQEFGNLIHHAYPSQDYDDLMSGVDAVIELGYVDPGNLFVTGGSGGGVLSAWIVGKTDRFRAAVVAKPVINWYSFVLTSDAYNFFAKYWFPAFPWDDPQHYLDRSPLSLVGNVSTPTMLLTGEEDYRTPMSESEQFYQALQLRKVESALIRIPGVSHGIARRPGNLISKVAHILAWFDKYSTNGQTTD